ncbi:uncharacterized protein [Nicotiana tomentosiformis]|uniref:uncharacterized protein n=1 Tax=Nicotiana tomentosiformis TaxID=4098 RepID=UPI00388C716B
MRRYCPHLTGGPIQQRGQATTSAPVTSPPMQSGRDGTQAVQDRPRRGGRSGCGQALCYAFLTWAEVVDSDVVITGIVSVCHKDTLVLFDPRSTYSYVSSYFARYLDTPRDSLVILVHVSIMVGDSIIGDRVYRSCVVTIGRLETRVDLFLLSIVDVDVIVGMDWLPPCHATLDYHAKTVTLAMPGFPKVE